MLYLSVAEAAAMLGVSRGTLERGCREQIAARAPWGVCKACGLAKRHRPAEKAA